jgi:hypothetical protein
MTDQEIRDLFDENLNLTLRELSNISGKSVEELKNILMGN